MPANATRCRPGRDLVLIRETVRAAERLRRCSAGVSPPALAISDAVEAVKDSAVMRRMNLRILIQAAGDNPISLRRKHVMENLIGPN
jgi:hypothetical protein